MTGPLTDQEHYWTETQKFFDDVDREDSATGFEDPLADPGGSPGGHEPDDPDTPPTDLDDLPGDQYTGPVSPAISPPPAGQNHLAHTDTDRRDRSRETVSGAVDLNPPEPQDSATDDGEDSGQADTGGEPAPMTPSTSDLPAAVHPAEAASVPAPADDTSEPAAPRYNKKIAMGFVAATAAAALVASGALMAMRAQPHIADRDRTTSRPSTQLSVVAAPSTTAAGVGEHDSAIPYTATSVGCLPGSSAAQAAAGPDPTQAWVCVTGGNVGQYVVLNLGRTMLITAVALTPGWVGADTSGTDQWHQHRVVTRVQWSFNDSPPTVVPQDTGSVHGEATKPIPERGVLASRVIVLVQETARSPADAAPTTSPAPGSGGLFGDILGPPATEQPPPGGATAVLPGLPGDPTHTDPADNSFAVSSIKIFGHPPQ